MDREKYFNENRGADLRKAGPNGRTKTWNVSEMWELHHEIARRVVLGQKNVVIAEALGCTPQTVSNVRNSPIVQDQMAIMKSARDADTVDLAREIQEIAPLAMQNLRRIIEDGELDGEKATLSLRAKESRDMIARAGFGVPQRIHSESVSVTLTSTDIADIKRRARENSDVIDITSTSKDTSFSNSDHCGNENLAETLCEAREA